MDEWIKFKKFASSRADLFVIFRMQMKGHTFNMNRTFVSEFALVNSNMAVRADSFHPGKSKSMYHNFDFDWNGKISIQFVFYIGIYRKKIEHPIFR